MTQPAQLGRYKLLRRLAVGGMAEVFLAEFPGPQQFRKRVVIKRMLDHLLSDSAAVAMFLDEARLTGRFSHPNLVQTFELIQIEQQYAIVMEYIEGLDLQVVIDTCRAHGEHIPDPLATYVITRAALGLEYAHGLCDDEGAPLRIVHRDLSPTNIVLTKQGDVKVLDFGIAAYEGARLDDGELKGKALYMSPEQALGESLDHRSDLYALGAVFFELLTTVPLYAQRTQDQVLTALARRPTLPADLGSLDVPAPVLSVLKRLLSGKVDQRPPRAEDVSRELESYLATVTRPQPSDVAAFVNRLSAKRVDQRPESTVPLGSHEIAVVGELAEPALAIDRERHTQMMRMGTRLHRGEAVELDGDRRTLRPTRPMGAPKAEPQEQTQPPRHRGRAMLAAGLLALGLVVVGALWSLRVPKSTHDVAAPAPVPAPAPTPTAPPPDAPTVPTPQPEPDSSTLADKPSNTASPGKARTGELSITSEPRLDVYIGRQKLGSTPISRAHWPAGRVRVSLRNDELGINKTVEMVVPNGGVARQDVKVGSGLVAFQIDPWAHIFFKGKKIATTPVAPLTMYEGRHEFTLVNPDNGRSSTVNVQVTPGKTSKVMRVLR